jgi:hypothetical protein
MKKKKEEYQYFDLEHQGTQEVIQVKIGPMPVNVLYFRPLVAKAFKEKGKRFTKAWNIKKVCDKSLKSGREVVTTMKKYKAGEKSKGPCEKCRGIVNTTYKYAPYKYQGDVLPRLLQEVCNGCGRTVAIPQQSSEQLREWRIKKNPHMGSDFNDWLKEEGIYKEVVKAARKSIPKKVSTEEGARLLSGLDLIWMIALDYDGERTVGGLKSIIDEIKDIAVEVMNNKRKLPKGFKSWMAFAKARGLTK